MIFLFLWLTTAHAETATVEISATVLNSSDITDGVITGVQPVQVDDGIASF